MTRGRDLSFLKYSIRCLNFSQSSQLGALTHVERNATNKHVSSISPLSHVESLGHNGMEVSCHILWEFLTILINHEQVIWSWGVISTFGNRLKAIIILGLDKIICLHNSIQVLKHGHDALTLLGEIQGHPQILVDLAPMHLHCPRAIFKVALILVLEPTDGLINNLRRLVGPVIYMKTDRHLLPFDSLVGDTPILWIELEPMLGEALHKLLVVE